LRQRVLAAIERLGYEPNPVARAFGGRRTRIIELLVPLFIGPIFLHVLRGIEQALSGTDYTLLVRTIDDAADRDQAFARCCAPGRADGVLVFWLPPPRPFLKRIASEHLPAVLLNVTAPRTWSVGVDHDASARDAVDYCFRIGHRRIALVDRPVDVFDRSSPGMCVDGYRAALEAAGLERRPSYEHKSELSQAGGAAALERLFALPEPPTAIVAASDAQAIGVLQAARQRGLQVPGDVSVVGYSDSQYAEYLGLTTISVPVREIGREATWIVLGSAKSPASAPQTIYVPTRIQVRGTCGPPAA
jgi:DNA-binding LacI/PurR family transcriptional regulator